MTNLKGSALRFQYRLIGFWIVARIASSFVVKPQGSRIHDFPHLRTAGPAITSSRSVEENESDDLEPVVLRMELQMKLSSLVKQRAAARWDGNYKRADSLRGELRAIELPSGYSLQLADIPRAQGGGSTWKLVYEPSTGRNPYGVEGSNTSILRLAHGALGMAVYHSERGLLPDSLELQFLVSQAKNHLLAWASIDSQVRSQPCLSETDDSNSTMQPLIGNDPASVSSWISVEQGLRGRKAADAAFWFSLAGCNDNELFALLSRVSKKELLRFGSRPRCRVRDVMAIANRLTAAGVRDDSGLEEAISRCLKIKGGIASSESPGTSFHLHSDQCALMIWKYATRQRKQQAFLANAANHWQRLGFVRNSTDTSFQPFRSPHWSSIFSDPSLPLVVDVGCGMGVTLLGLASLDNDNNLWSQCNFLGVDLSAIAISYAKGIAQRWALCRRLAFVHAPAEQLLASLDSYPGRIQSIMIQFPTPYRLAASAEKAGNTQLPSSALDGFMVTSEILNAASELLMNKNKGVRGHLLIQSNCEDVAVWMRNSACCNSGFKALHTLNPVINAHDTPTQRTLNWAAMGGERAIGPEWSASPILPRQGHSETEVACALNKIPVHRTVLEPS